MENVVLFDWKLNSARPFSYQEHSYDLRHLPPRPDMHSALHLALSISGHRIGVFANETLTTNAGEFYLTAPWEPHYTTFTSDGHRLLLINIDWESLQHSFFTGRARLEQLLLMKPGERMNFINRKLKDSSLPEKLLHTIREMQFETQLLMIWNLVQQIFITTLPESGSTSCAAGSYQRLLPALSNLSGKLLTQPEAAALCSLSTSYFARLFKQHFALSFAQYERNFRLNGAAGALDRGATLKEAADAWGFCDKSHLARLLKKRS